MKLPPCINCERRTARPNCHAKCAEYKEFVIERNKISEKRRAEGNLYEYINMRNKRTKG